MATSTYTIKCAICNVPVEGPSNPKPQDMISCPGCGLSDKFENVEREIANYVEEQTAKFMNRSLTEAFSGSKFVKVTPGHIPHRRYRFVVDLNL